MGEGQQGMDLTSVHRARVNGAFLHEYHGKPVCVFGTVIKAEAGMACQIRTSDGQQVNIRLKTPIRESLHGLVEVVGMGQGRNLIVADRIHPIPESISKDFDMATYNEALVILQDKKHAWLP